MEQLSKKEVAIISVISLTLTCIILSRTDLLVETTPDFIKPWDHHKYIFMAQHPLHFHIAPFCWRILQPLIASVLPFSLETNFILIAVISVFLSGIFIYIALKLFGLNTIPSMVGILMFFSSPWATKWILYNIWMVDGLTNTIFALALVLIIGKKDMWLMVLLSIGVLVKESVILIVPLHYTLYATSLWDSNKLFQTIKIAIPSVLILLAIRLSIPEYNADQAYVYSLDKKLTVEYPNRLTAGYSMDEKNILEKPHIARYSYVDLAKTIGWNRIQQLSLTDLQKLTTGTFGVVIICLTLFTTIVNKNLVLRLTPLFILTYMQLAFAVNTERLLIIALPAVVLFAAKGVELLHQQYRIDQRIFLIIFSLIFILNMVHTNPFPYQYGKEWSILCLIGFCYLVYKKYSSGKNIISF
jgi:hypothetical protein